MGEIVRRLADGTASLAVGPDDVEAAHAPPRKRRRPAAAQSKAKPAAEIKGPAGEVEGGASGAEDADGRAGTGKSTIQPNHKIHFVEQFRGRVCCRTGGSRCGCQGWAG